MPAMKRTLHYLLLIALLLGWAHTVYRRSAGQGSLVSPPSGSSLSARLSLAAKYCDPLAPPIKSLLLRLALMSEDDPTSRSVILDQPISAKAQQALSPGFRLMAQYRAHPDPATEQQLRILASSSLLRLNGVFIVQSIVFLLALASILLGSRQVRSPHNTEIRTLGYPASTVIGLYCAWDTLSDFLAGQLYRVPGLVNGEFAALYASAGLSYLLLAVLLALVGRHNRWKPGWRGGLGWVGPAYLICFFGIHLIEFVLSEIFAIALPESTFLLRLAAQATPVQALGLSLVIGVVGPFFEELILRGWLLGGLAARWGPNNALLLSSLIFAAAHGISAHFPGMLLLGWVFGWVYLRSGSLWTCFAVHALWNATALANIFAQAPL